MCRSRSTRPWMSVARSAGTREASSTRKRFGLRGGQREELLPHTVVERGLLRLEPIERLVVGVEAVAGERRVEVQEDGEVGKQALRGPQRQIAHLVAPEDAAGALVGDGGVEVAVLDDDVAALERRAHDVLDVVRPVGGVQQCLRARRDLAAMVQHDVADQDPDLGAAGLAGAHDGVPARGEPLLEECRLRGLADAVTALERDEEATHFLAGALRAVVAFRAGVRLGAGPLARLSAIICTAIS